MSKRHLLVLTTAILATGSSVVAAAEDLDSLVRKRASLETELERVKAEIARLEAAANSDGQLSPPPKWYIKSFGIDEINSAGGVEPFVVLFNPNAKSDIKYAVVRATLYNAVGDVIESTIGQTSTANLQFTGPLAMSDGERRVDWGAVWSNTTGSCIKIESLRVTFVDGKSVSFSGKNLRSALAPDLLNECKLQRRR